MKLAGKNGNFAGYNESYKAYKIYVPGERHVEVNRDVLFHEKEKCKRSKEIQYDTNTKDHVTPM